VELQLRRRRQRDADLLHGSRKQHIAMGCGGNTQIDYKRGNSVFVFTVD